MTGFFHAAAVFEVQNFQAAPVAVPPISTALPVGVFTMRKIYVGAVEGCSITLFTSAFDQVSGVGSYIAMESFEGCVDGHSGAFVFLHSASTRGADRTDEFFRIVESSGTGELAGISGTGRIEIAPDGTHRIYIDYRLESG
ncbi:DUF3224 domain-containing protein [Sphingopyxis sp. JAI128]|uniref:DUF3224 domain-containing protein n=1 Tax=Sphingopyxis sp. JAI128 TaxID=2723066 RepID=UPI00160ADD10|nr:DUF3224 domain-containing protein [Sphingopyxis sp. JAI128]MBB6426942.1 hypothetical protein [Sphingopyxis sp. JAI128]